MPGYLQVQTCLPVKTGREFGAAMRVAERLFVRSGLRRAPLRAWLAGFAWDDLLDVGFCGTADWEAVPLAGARLRIAPSICGFADHADPSIGSPWLEINALLDSADLCISLNDWRFRPEVGAPLWRLTSIFASVDQTSGIFLTDEAGNAKPWYALMGASDGLWAFDLALIPRHLAARFSETPQTHSAYAGAHGLGLARRAAWPVLPWATDQP